MFPAFPLLSFSVYKLILLWTLRGGGEECEQCITNGYCSKDCVRMQAPLSIDFENAPCAFYISLYHIFYKMQFL